MAGELTDVGKERSFDECRQAAVAWLETNSTPSEWHLLWADETEKQLVIEHQEKHISFRIRKSSTEGHECFKIGSDNESAWSLLKNCKGNSVPECLEWCTNALMPLVGCQEVNIADEDEDEDEDEDDEEDGNDYYNYSDDDMMDIEETSKDFEHDGRRSGKKSPVVVNEISEAEKQMYTTSGSKMAVHRLLSDLRLFQRSDGMFGIKGNPRGDNLFLWDVQLTDFEPKSVLGKDLAKYAEKYQQKPEVHLEMSFPSDYPMSPPFIRVIRPRFKFLTGHVTIGGSICMELLTKSGWRPTNDIESILVQVRSEITSDPNAGLDMREANRQYTQMEAETAFKRMVQNYGWNN